MNLFSATGLSISILCLILSLGIFRYAKEKTHYLWAFFNLTVAAWAFWSFQVGNSTSSDEAILNWKLSYMSATFISVIYYHMICVFCRIKRTKTILFFYIQGALFLPMIFYTEYFVSSTNYIFDSIFYHKATPLFTIWLALWTTIVSFSFSELRKFIKSIDHGLERTQALFLFWGMMVGFVGGVSTAIPAYGFQFYPIGQASICLYVIILIYAIIKHNFLRFRIVLRSLIVPSLVCGILVIILTYIIFHLSVFSLASLSLGVACLMLAFLVFAYSKYSLHRIWSFFNLAVFSWAMGTFFAGIAKTPQQAEMAWRWAYGLGPFVPSIFYHFVYSFCELNKKNTLRAVYLLGILFIPVNFFAPDFINEIEYIFDSIYYHKATLLFTIFMAYLGIVVFLSFKELINYLKIAKGNKRTQVLYILYGFSIGWGGGITTFLPPYGVTIYPAWHFTICIYTIIMTFAILKYQIMDIKIAGTRLGIFVLVYSLVLGIPFGLEIWGKEWLAGNLGKFGEWIPMLALLGFATAGPFIYLYIQKKAEDRLLQEQRRYQMTLRQASSGMSRVKDLRKLLKLIVHIVTRTVHIDHSSIYLYNDKEKKYLLEASRSRGRLDGNGVIERNSPLVKYLFDIREPIVYEEIKQRTQQYSDPRLQQIESNLRELDTAVLVPSFVEERLLAIIILGKKTSGNLYSEDDLAIFSILANQAALAIENAKFYEDAKRTQQQLFQAEKMATIGTMADGLSHQINNRLHALGFIAGDALDSIRLKAASVTSPDGKELLSEIEHALKKIQDNVKQGGEVVQGLLKYTRKGEEGFASVDLNKLVDASVEMAQYKVKLDQVSIVKDFSSDIPKIYGNFTQLQEVFFNLIDNAYDAMMQRKNEKNEENYQPKLTISAVKTEKMMQVSVLDNGIGVKEEDQDKLFTPFFTTKLSSKKGTGLGLYVIKKIIEENHKGKVIFSSEYMTGTLFTIHLPIVS